MRGSSTVINSPSGDHVGKLRRLQCLSGLLGFAVGLAGLAAGSAAWATDRATDKAADRTKDAASTLPATKPAAASTPPATKPAAAAAPAPVAAHPHKPSPSVAKPSPSFPKTVPEAKAEAEAAAKPPEKWSDAEIADGKARCAAILKRINAIAIPEAPIKEGACGAPAPIQLISIGTKPQVSISPPAIMTCELAEGLAAWIHSELQPLAKKHLGAEIIKIENMSSYACRNAYGRAKNKLSEHGVANALDIRGFTTAAGKTALVLEDWGTPQREIVARIAAAKAAAAKAEEARLAAEKAAQTNQLAVKGAQKAPGTPPSATASTSGGPASGLAKTTIVDGIPKVTVTLPGARPATADPEFAISPDKLGGPKDKIKDKEKAAKGAPSRDAVTAVPATKRHNAAALPVPSDKAPAAGGGAKSAFLHAAHATACQIFGTTLGPEANEAHRNHFHVDMAVRKHTKICD